MQYLQWRTALACGGLILVLTACGGDPPPTPAGLAIPVSFAVVSLLFAAISAALFARVATLQLSDGDQDSDDDDGGPGRGPNQPAEPPGDGGLEFDWDGFERDFRAHCDRVPSLR